MALSVTFIGAMSKIPENRVGGQVSIQPPRILLMVYDLLTKSMLVFVCVVGMVVFEIIHTLIRIVYCWKFEGSSEAVVS